MKRGFRWRVVTTLIVSVLMLPQRARAGESREHLSAQVRVELVHERSITLRLVGPSPQLDEISCTGPCEQWLAPGAYRMYARQGNEHWPADWLYFWKPQRVEVRPPNQGAQKAGRVMATTFGGIFGVSLVVFIPTMLVGFRC